MAKKKLTTRQIAVMQKANSILKHYALIEQGWSFKFDFAKARAGICRYHIKQISISRHFVEVAALEEVIDTILHEVAHARLPAGVGHSKQWKELAKSMGCNAQRCHNLNFSQPKYIQSCTNGCWERKLLKKVDTRYRVCSKCNSSIALKKIA